MKNIKYKNYKVTLLLGLILFASISCERDLSEDAELSTFSKNGVVFIDAFSAGLGYGAFGGSKLTAFIVDTEEKYQGTASMRFDVPSVGDPEGGFAGGVFIDGSGRNLTDYDALTFWVKGSKAATINEVGFGNNFGENKYNVTMSNVSIGTNWQKVTIPIPDASKLVQEKGMFWYAEGPENGLGYTFWIDNVQYEKLGTIAQPQPKILNGLNVTEQTFIGSNSSLTGLSQTFNMGNGINQTVTASPSYFEFASSNPGVASVDKLGKITISTSGTATITAKLNGVAAAGSLILNSLGVFTPAPTPTQLPANVLSIFSDNYTNVPVQYYNGYYAPFQTTQGQADINVNGNNVIKYSQFNFVGIQFAQPTLNATTMTHIHLDVKVQNTTGLRNSFKLALNDFGADATFGGGNDTGFQVTIVNSNLPTGNWVSIDIPLSNFTGLVTRTNLAQIILESATGITDILVDNIYFYKVPTAPTVAAPTPTLPAGNVISLFSNAYTNVPVDTWRTPWSSATFADVTIAGNATKEYSNLDFVGIETVNNQINATGMTFVHIDVWSANFNTFAIKLVDFGANAVFGGGDDREHQVNFTAPTRGQWVSYDLPLSSFTGLTTRQNLAQYILVSQPSGSAKIYIDNFYFHN